MRRVERDLEAIECVPQPVFTSTRDPITLKCRMVEVPPDESRICHGYMELVKPNETETKQGVDYGGCACCVRVFQCKRCGNRQVCYAEAPEADWDRD